MVFNEKSDCQEEGVHKKTKNREDCFKSGLGQLADLIGGFAKKEEWCF